MWYYFDYGGGRGGLLLARAACISTVCTVIIVVDIVALAKLSGAGHARASSNPSTLARDGGEREEEEERPLWID